MTRLRARRSSLWALAAVALLALGVAATARGPQAAAAVGPGQQRPVFGAGVDLVVVHATVTDREGYFVRGLREGDFEVREDGRPQAITAFSSERVPVSIGIALDLSNSMKGEKLRAAKAALARLLDELLDPEDEVFLYCFSDQPALMQSWTTRRDLLRRALDRLRTGGLTALYDTTAEAVNLAVTGKHRKKALVIISDGSDTASHTDLRALKQQIQKSEVLVYAIGIDSTGSAPTSARGAGGEAPGRWPGGPPDHGPPQFPPRPPAGRGGTGASQPPPPRAPIPKDGQWPAADEADAAALRALTDDSGGRTAIIRGANDLSPATAGIADELSRQYFLGYQGAAPRDGRWHAIEVTVRRPDVRVRARSGYFAPAAGQ